MSLRGKLSAIHCPRCIRGWMYWEEVYGCVELICLQCGYSRDIGLDKSTVSTAPKGQRCVSSGNREGQR